MAKDTLRHMPLALIKPSDVALRSVDKEDEKYIGIVDSIRQFGVINPISVREMKDAETGKTIYGLIDGLHRYTGSVDAGLDSIPVHIMQANEVELLEMQIIGNLHVVETKPAEYSKQLTRLLKLNPTMTTTELATKLGKSTSWLNERLNLLKLTEKIQDLVNDSTINITNAYHLAKLPQEEQDNFVDRAMTMTPSEFVPTVSARTKELRDARRQGRAADGEKVFQPPIYLQKISDLKAELREQTVGKGLINQFGLKDPVEVWKMAVCWMLHIDPISADISKTKDEEKRKLREEEKAAKKKERDKKKDKEAAMVAAGLDDDEDEDLE
jgi:ParB/RepB/Spo0J family partition protein